MMHLKHDKRTVKVLYLATDPGHAPPLSLGQEFRDMARSIHRTVHGDAIELVAEWAVELSDIQRVLHQHQPHVLHLSGHGSPTGQHVADGNGHSRVLRADVLADLVRL